MFLVQSNCYSQGNLYSVAKSSLKKRILKAYHLAAAHLFNSSARPSAILWTETQGSCFVKKEEKIVLPQWGH